MNPVSKRSEKTGRGLLSLDGRKFWGLILGLPTPKVSHPQSNNTVDLHCDLVFWELTKAQHVPTQGHSVIFGLA